MRTTVNDGFSLFDGILYTSDELFGGVDVLAAGELASASQFTIATRLDPSLMLRWTVGGSTDFDVYFRLYDVPGYAGVAIEDVPIAQHLTSASDAGIIIPVRESGSLYNTIYYACRLVIKNNDAGALLHIVTSNIVQAKI
jgi:hypothetical protein